MTEWSPPPHRKIIGGPERSGKELWKRSEVRCDGCGFTRKQSSGRKWASIFRIVKGFMLCPQCREMTMVGANDKVTNRAFGYVRASTTMQEMTIEAQKDRIREYCGYRNLELVDFFIDKASASKVKFNGRPAGRALNAAVGTGDHIVMAKYDRGFRNVVDCLTMYDRWCNQGIHLHFAAENGLVPPTPHGKFILTLMVAAAEHESGSMGQRQRAVNRVRRANLRPGVTRFPITGFVFREIEEFDKKKGENVTRRLLLLNEDERENAQLFYRMKHEEGYSLIRTAKWAKKNKVFVPRSARQYDERIDRHYSSTRIRRLLALETELRSVMAGDPDKNWTMQALGDAWQKEFFATGRTSVTLTGSMRRNKPTPAEQMIET